MSRELTPSVPYYPLRPPPAKLRLAPGFTDVYAQWLGQFWGNAEGDFNEQVEEEDRQRGWRLSLGQDGCVFPSVVVHRLSFSRLHLLQVPVADQALDDGRAMRRRTTPCRAAEADVGSLARRRAALVPNRSKPDVPGTGGGCTFCPSQLLDVTASCLLCRRCSGRKPLYVGRRVFSARVPGCSRVLPLLPQVQEVVLPSLPSALQRVNPKAKRHQVVPT